MIQTTLAYVGDFLANYFFQEFEGNPTKRVVYGDNDSYFKELKTNRLEMPGLCFCLTQLNLPHGPSKPTKFSGYDNAGGTKALVYNAKMAMITCSMAIYCTNAQQSFYFIQKYLELQHNAVIPVTYWANDVDQLIIDCALTNFEDASIPAMGRKSSDQDSTGLIYEIECGFSIPTLFLETEQHKLIRCIKFEKRLRSRGNIYEIIGKDEFTDTMDYLEELAIKREKLDGKKD